MTDAPQQHPTLTFLGGAGNVTGSKTLVTAGGQRWLVDCGLFQERDLRDRNWREFPVPPAELTGILLTHAHVDHCALIPRLYALGFRGPVLGTAATLDIVRIVLPDSGHLQEEDARYKAKRHAREGRKGPHPEEPLYTRETAEESLSLLRPVPFDEPVDLGGGWRASWHACGHILGAASVRVEAPAANGKTVSVLFSGDVARWERPLLRDPAIPPAADYLVLESTYGNRKHVAHKDDAERLGAVLNETVQAGGNLVIPSFAIERTQDLLYHLARLREAKQIPPVLVFVDSPMAASVTDVFTRHAELFDDETRALIKRGVRPYDFPGLVMSRTVSESKAINSIRGSAVIIAGSGMCTGGRIKHHLKANLERPESTILFVGYQAAGTLGRVISEGATEVRVLGEKVPVKAKVVKLGGFSGHADQDELLRWLGALTAPPRQVFINHGEEQTAAEFAALVTARLDWPARAVQLDDCVPLEG
ncbi:MAG: MBL fold metallo-hydrolase [Candidatus Marinimicrobia bacterium]|nr:MBL fold metallo-hydrolase [Candidatus Neomarinimicrobiota bacterium]